MFGLKNTAIRLHEVSGMFFDSWLPFRWWNKKQERQPSLGVHKSAGSTEADGVTSSKTAV